jgi:hypothetical protein
MDFFAVRTKKIVIYFCYAWALIRIQDIVKICIQAKKKKPSIIFGHVYQHSTLHNKNVQLHCKVWKTIKILSML